MNAFDKIICILLVSVLMFLSPLFYLAQKQDVINQVYVESKTVEFVNDIKNHGYITANMYERYLDRLGDTGNLYVIEMVHAHTVVNPEYDEDSGAFLDDYYTYQESTYQDDILMEIFEGTGTYYLRQGDYVSIKVYNKTETFAGRMLRMIGVNQKTQILITYGGIIRDENY